MDINIGSEYLISAQKQMNLSQLTTMKNKDYSGLEDKQLKDVSREFAALLIEELYKSMRKTVCKGQWLDGGLEQDIFEDMLYTEYARQAALQGKLGLGDMVYHFLKHSYCTHPKSS